jgi:Glucosidase II beta subunit-like protein
MILGDKDYLCAIPTVEDNGNNTQKNLSKAEEEKELSLAATRGWELLKEMEGKCMYFMAGWWSYSFCHNSQIKQFHQMPAPRNVPMFSPVEDPTVTSFVLGKTPSMREKKENDPTDTDSNPAATTELQTKGETRYLVQRLGGGTICDLTGQERKVEVQVSFVTPLRPCFTV